MNPPNLNSKSALLIGNPEALGYQHDLRHHSDAQLAAFGREKLPVHLPPPSQAQISFTLGSSKFFAPRLQ
jgi:hypothetical protein